MKPEQNILTGTFRITRISAADIPRLSVFLATHTKGRYDEAAWEKIFDWMWLSNPYAKIDEANFGWGIEDAAQNIKGFIGNIPVQYTSATEVYPAIWGSSWYVDEIAKDLSLKMYINFIRQTEILLSNSQTDRVEIVMKKMGFEELPVEWYTGRYIFPLHILNIEFIAKMFSEFSVKKIAACLVGMICKIPQAFIFLLYNRNSYATDILITKINSFPNNTDAWFDEFKQTQECTLIRNRQTLEWLFCHPGSENDFAVCQVSYENKLQGFLVYKRRTIKEISYWELMDEALLSLPDSIKKQIILKTLFTLYKETRNINFVLLRSNLANSSGFFKRLFGISISKGEKGYIKSVKIKPAITRSTFTSVDGDMVFF